VVDGDGMQGYIVCKVDPASGEGYIDYIGVAETARRNGIGRRLLAAALRWMFSYPTVHRVDLTVTTTNEAALGLYAALGFEQERIMRAFRKQVSVR
jgi:ribosomal protein S18 acetylase RimI-like enzyme